MYNVHCTYMYNTNTRTIVLVLGLKNFVYNYSKGTRPVQNTQCVSQINREISIN